MPFLICLSIQVGQSQIDLRAALQVGIFVTEPNQNVFRITLFCKRIEPQQQCRLSQSVPAINVDDVLITWNAMIPPFTFCEVAQAILPYKIEQVVPEDAVAKSLQICQATGFTAAVIGKVVKGNKKVQVNLG